MKLWGKFNVSFDIYIIYNHHLILYLKLYKIYCSLIFLFAARPWLVDDLDLWLSQIEIRQPHKCAAIFVDNCGVDLVLGIIPFARELLKRGTRVLLCSNSEPALNDVTHTELLGVLGRASAICPIMEKALKDKLLIPVPTAQSGPCLDFR